MQLINRAVRLESSKKQGLERGPEGPACATGSTGPHRNTPRQKMQRPWRLQPAAAPCPGTQ